MYDDEAIVQKYPAGERITESKLIALNYQWKTYSTEL